MPSIPKNIVPGSRLRLLSVSALVAVGGGCGDARSPESLVADADREIASGELVAAMYRLDTVRVHRPDDATAHLRYAQVAEAVGEWLAASAAYGRTVELDPDNPNAREGLVSSLVMAGIVESDIRLTQRALEKLPEALRIAPDRTRMYRFVESGVRRLNLFEAYEAIVMEALGGEHDDVLLHQLASARLNTARFGDPERTTLVADSLTAALHELAASVELSVESTPTPTIYRLAAGHDLLGDPDESKRWLEVLTQRPDRGPLGEQLEYWTLYRASYGSSDDSREGRRAALAAGFERFGDDPRLRAPFEEHRFRFFAEEAGLRTDSVTSTEGTPWRAHLPPGYAEPVAPPLGPDLEVRLTESTTGMIRWTYSLRANRAAWGLRTLLFYGVEPETVLATARAMREELEEDRPGTLYPGDRGDERERSRQDYITRFRILEARALTQLGRVDEADILFRELAHKRRGARTLAEFGRHLLREGEPAPALEALVDASLFGYAAPEDAERLHALVKTAAHQAGWEAAEIDELIAARTPVIELDLERRLVGTRLEQPAPDMVLTDLKGTEWRLADLRGKVVVLKFWAVWCLPCIEEFPYFVQWIDTYESDQRVAFVTIVTETPRETAVDFVGEQAFDFPVLFDEGTRSGFQVLALPTTLYIDREGIVQFKVEGFVADNYARDGDAKIDALLSRPGDG